MERELTLSHWFFSCTGGMERECTTFFKHLIKFHDHREKKNAAPVHDQLAEMSDLFSVTEACNVHNLGLTIAWARR